MIWIVLQLAFVAVGAMMMRSGRVRPRAEATPAPTPTPAADVIEFHPELIIRWDESDYATDHRHAA